MAYLKRYVLKITSTSENGCRSSGNPGVDGNAECHEEFVLVHIFFHLDYIVVYIFVIFWRMIMKKTAVLFGAIAILVMPMFAGGGKESADQGSVPVQSVKQTKITWMNGGNEYECII
jgi:hypothetical protein